MTSPRRQKAICPAHVEDPILRDHIAAHATKRYCSYCTVEAPAPMAATLRAFLPAFMVGVDIHYQPHRHLGAVDAGVVEAAVVAAEILRIAGVDQDVIVEDVAKLLAVNPYWVARDHRTGSRLEQLTYSWETFKHLVKHEMRFFFAKSTTGSGDPGDMTAEQLLEAVSDVGQNTAAVWPIPCPSPLFRARMARSDTEASKWLCASHIGPPPPEKAAANRMSPAGISIFYGATDRATAIAEAGSHTFYRYVVTGEFTPTRDIHLVDLTNLPEPPSIFDAANRKKYFGLSFLHKFIHDITLPVELDGREHIDYVPTQVFTEYLRYAFPGAVDGLMFASTQGPGNNVAIFAGADACVDNGTETEDTWLTLDTATVHTTRVMTVAR